MANLKQLWMMEWNYAVQFGGPEKRMPDDTGSAFWIKLTKTNPPLIDESLSDIFVCPVTRARQYRGPSGDVNYYGDGDPVGA